MVETRGRFTVYKVEGHCHRQRVRLGLAAASRLLYAGSRALRHAPRSPRILPRTLASQALICGGTSPSPSQAATAPAEACPPGLVERCDSAFTGRSAHYHENWGSTDSWRGGSAQQLEADVQTAREEAASLRAQLAALMAVQQHEAEAAAAASATLAARLAEQQARAEAAESRCGRLREQLAQAQAVIGSLAESRGDAFEERLSLRAELRELHASLEQSQRTTARLAEAMDEACEEAAAAAREEGRRQAAAQWQGRVAELRKQVGRGGGLFACSWGGSRPGTTAARRCIGASGPSRRPQHPWSDRAPSTPRSWPRLGGACSWRAATAAPPRPPPRTARGCYHLAAARAASPEGRAGPSSS